ncbi:UDP-3-O-(3-hydroxymyristoyl) glucosamine N-acyltransferase [Anaeromyxobacter dehalogenans 2CP-1]|uniref:UDP-3-O-acylglucosamine N-acyltransferase n=1 Tax=Anaeromyxobacter dehalogenans (strain ATCC BAA-258 / DSM 21875 / 2CP-1) TaxID=455488 RepID=LPXD_ANAD2|nr:UDP-3-O-(3-hydroxymyristoyl)glucosamine N-acyltransferase [Anaeromyxobacter dehalogenans]B8JFW7.1 RecName: Full=UDP-3-O-acylglucosamine N-acyltransferase [Anaeromyxobacter dehalogenans 2CP-1]ACL64555.1 UDP-3-O-(3-hydroxymyristoyl) glucosamine N-acyltransferase [Anaeromyxobacter dehalogenans 2CP-1]
MASYTLAELAARVGGAVEGDGSLRLDGISPLEEASASEISFFSNRKYRKAFEASRAGAVVVEPDEQVAAGRTVLRVANAYLAFAKISTLFHPPREAVPEVAPTAVIHPTARVHPSAQVMPLACVGPDAQVGARTILFPGVHVADGARVGEDCVFYHNVVVRERCAVGNRVILQPGCVIGSDGFGFAFDPEGEGKGPRHYKVPQVGNVVIEDDVEVGANTCVDRATLGTTRIGRGAKIDNLVQIAHNVQVGPLSLLVSQVGVAGSTKLGMGVVAGGQAGIVGHLEIGDGVRIGAQSGVMADVEAGETVSGSPAVPHGNWLKAMASLDHLHDMRKELRSLRREVERLRADAGEDEP